MAPKKKGSKPKASLDTRIASDSKLRARVLKNPGLRSKLSDATLKKYAPQQASRRALTKRLNTPIAPGSQITERDLAHEAQAAQTVRYAPQERELGQQIGISQQTERDTGSFYDQYQQALQNHAANIQAFQAGAQQAMQQAAAGVTGLGTQQAVQLQQAQNATATPGVAPAGDLTSMANQAQAVRQGLMASQQVQDVQQGTATQNFASNLANVVAPTQKLSALSQARGRTRDLQQKRTDLRTEEGAFNQQFRQERRGEEFKNQLALGALNLNTQKAQAGAAADAAAAASKTPEAQAAAQSGRSEAQTAAKYGYSLHDWRMLGPTRRQQIIAKAKKSGGGGTSDTTYTTGAFAGMTKSEVAALTPQQRKQKVDDYNKGKKSDDGSQTTKARDAFRDKFGVDLQATSQHNTARSNVEKARAAFKIVGTKDKSGKTVTTQQVYDALVSKYGDLWARAALEIFRNGGISAGTAKRIHKAGYSVGTLGFKMGKPKRPYKPPSSGPASKIPGVGGN